MTPDKPARKRLGLVLAGLLLLGLLATLASPLPDGLEWAMEKLGIRSGEATLAAPLPGYAWPGRLPGWLQNVLSALAGGLAVWALLRLAAWRRRP